MSMLHYIFGYGSLVNQEALYQYLGRHRATQEAQLCQLQGFRRCWNVAIFIAEAYFQFVYDCFCSCSEAMGQAYLEVTDPPEVPLKKLKRVDLIKQINNSTVLHLI